MKLQCNAILQFSSFQMIRIAPPTYASLMISRGWSSVAMILFVPLFSKEKREDLRSQKLSCVMTLLITFASFHREQGAQRGED